MSTWDVLYAVLWALVLALCALVIALLRHVGALELRIDELARSRVSRIDRNGIPVGSTAPTVRLLESSGAEVSFTPEANRRSLVVVSQPGCAPCDRLLSDLGRLASESSAPAVTVITKVGAAPVSVHPDIRMLYQRGAEAMIAYRAFATPWVFVIGPDRVVEAQGIAGSPGDLQRLLADARRFGDKRHNRSTSGDVHRSPSASDTRQITAPNTKEMSAHEALAK